MARANGTSKILALLMLSACAGATHGVEPSGPNDEASAADAAPALDADRTTGGDAALDASLDSASDDAASHADSQVDSPDASAQDAESVDAAPNACVYPFEFDYGVCAGAAAVISAGQTLTGLNSAEGARGDCAMHGSGTGGRNLYFRLSVPAGRETRVVATSTSLPNLPVVRILAGCYAAEAETGARGFADGKATVCVANTAGISREVIVAVGLYSALTLDQTLQFNLTAELLPNDKPCVP